MADNNSKMLTYLQGLYVVTNPDLTALVLRYLNVTAAATADYTARMKALITAAGGVP